MIHIFVPELSGEGLRFARTLVKKNEKDVKLWIPREQLKSNLVLKTALAIKPVEDGVSVNWESQCYEWESQSQRVHPQSDIYRYWLERNRLWGSGNDWDIFTTERKAKSQATFFLDHPSDKSYPREWQRFPCVSSIEDLNTFLNDRDFLIYQFRIGDQFEEAKNDYRHTRNSTVLKERSSGYLWYLDTLHRDHFEVFDPQGKKHLGEADVKTGHFDRSKADKNKKPIL